jgi:hypothetical protein
MRCSTAKVDFSEFDWSQFAVFRGAEGEGDDSGTNDPPADPPNDEGDEGDDGGDPPEDKEDTSGLKSALQKERADRRKLEKDLKALQRAQKAQEDAEKSDLDKASEALKLRETQVTALASTLRESSLEAALSRAAVGLKFRDTDDVIRLVDRSAIDIDQDEDNPADITIDEKSVQIAVQALAKKKPHLLIADGQQDPSGSPRGGSKKTSAELTEEDLKKKYPAL